jgi:hypothetical protein
MNLTAVLPRTTLTNRKRQSLPLNYDPTDVDVCCGRGKRNWNHVGNVNFRKLIQNNVERYVAAPTKNEKTAVVISLVDEVREQGGHFLKQNVAGSWFDIGDHQAREKVGHSLRDQVTSVSRHKNKQQAMHEVHPQADKAARKPRQLVDNSDTHSDSGRDCEVRRATLSSSLIVDAFQRRPSFLSLSIDSLKKMQVHDVDTDVSHSFNSHGSVRSSLKFLEGLDLEELYNEHMLVEPFTSLEAV